MAAFVKFERFSEGLAKAEHGNLHTQTIKAYLSNTAPNVATHTAKADIAEIATGNGYAGPVDTTNTVSRSGGTTSVVGVDMVITATGAVGPFRYVILFTEEPTTPIADPLIGYWDYGSSISLANGETFTIDLAASMFTVA